jgi:hypothetical protein
MGLSNIQFNVLSRIKRGKKDTDYWIKRHKQFLSRSLPRMVGRKLVTVNEDCTEMELTPTANAELQSYEMAIQRFRRYR